jgi:hypothetical protein
MKRLLTSLFTVAAVVSLTGLTGCATRWVVDSDVQSFSKIAAVPAGSTFRFERLPSQQSGAAQESQAQLEAMAQPALERAGLKRDDAAARYSAQVGARVSAELSPWADPWLQAGPWGPRYGGWALGYGRVPYGGFGYGWYGPGFPPAVNPWYEREVSIVLRALPSNEVVYETRARNDGPYTSSPAILTVMFEAALHGFPNPPQGARRVDLEILPRQP